MIPDDQFDFAAFPMGNITLASIQEAHPELISEMSSFHPLKTASIFSGLLLEPELQGNCPRIEALVHIAVAFCKGKRKPTAKHVQRWFEIIGSGQVGMFEDPTEDVFVSNVSTSKGNYKIIEGLGESSGFYLQRFVNLIERMPSVEPYSSMREAAFSLLKLSNLICEKAKLQRFQLGEEMPLENIPTKILSRIKRYGRWVRFTEKEMKENSIDVEKLRERGLVWDDSEMNTQSMGNTNLEARPIAFLEGELFVLMPSTISNAIRRMVIDYFCSIDGGKAELFRNLAEEYHSLLEDISFSKLGLNKSLKFKHGENGTMAATLVEIDRGRYINYIFILDQFEEYSHQGLLGLNVVNGALAEDIDYCIDAQLGFARKQSGFISCLTILVTCGAGRGVSLSLSVKTKNDHSFISLNVADFSTLSWLDGFDDISFLRILDAEQKLENIGIKLQNINGFLNLVAWNRMLKGHMVPHSDMPEQYSTGNAIIVIDQNRVRELRKEVAETFDFQVVKNIEGNFVRVAKTNDSIFKEDKQKPLYAALDFSVSPGVPLVVIAPKRSWWAQFHNSNLVASDVSFGKWKILNTWLPKIVEVLDEVCGFPEKQEVLWEMNFVMNHELSPEDIKIIDYEGAKQELSYEINRNVFSIKIEASPDFEYAFMNTKNIAEKAIVYKVVESFTNLANLNFCDNDIETLTTKIVSNDSGRQFHMVFAQDFRGHLNEQLSRAPITLTDLDDATSRIGLGWKVRDRSEGGEIIGKTECTQFLNKLVGAIEDEICLELRVYNREYFLNYAIDQHERAVVDRDNWRRTTKAVIGLKKDRVAAVNVITDHEFKLNAVFQASRLLVEMSICESSEKKDKKIGKLEFSRLMSKILLVVHFGGCSDAIRWGVMEPKLQIRPLGDVHMNYQYFEETLIPFGKSGVAGTIVESIKDYDKQVEQPTVVESIRDAFPEDFLNAWEEEFGYTIDEIRQFINCVENIGIQNSFPILTNPKSVYIQELSDETGFSTKLINVIICSLILQPRTRWKDVPSEYKDTDRQPWRFGRRLSVLRKPVLQIDHNDDPTLLIAPGILRDAFGYILSNFYRGGFPHWQINSKAMRKWSGSAYNKEGEKFNNKVGDKLISLGWKVDKEVQITKLLRKGFDKDFGDVDIVASHPESGRVILIECKNLKYKKTPGEIAEQISDFQGKLTDSGKADLLLKHLNRVDLIKKHPTELAEYVGMSEVNIEHMLVFKNPVPMKYAWEKLKDRTALHIFDELQEVLKLS